MKCIKTHKEGYNKYSDYTIEPDLGIIKLIKINNESNPIDEFIVFCGECKKQGTNDNLIVSQAIGNAIERDGRYVVMINNYCAKEAICPYICFVHGCDCESEYFQSKIVQLANGNELNKINLYKIDNNNTSSYFIQKQKYNSDFILETSEKLIRESLKYYIHKYNIY